MFIKGLFCYVIFLLIKNKIINNKQYFLLKLPKTNKDTYVIAISVLKYIYQ